ncbi:macrophage mannose receptor 1-like [Poeciliopsis prolifica]|uniref:macrophage mannose receptor 1-like n=1 Tax=Poeciliopsis prolifica TaxID=188132 RepID=UPI0024142BE6|nr:macrophage mannose receptor 1-like [Poeciliopsis prolifica]
MQWSLILLFLMGQCCFIDCQLYEFHYINESKNWTEAQQYCREKHTDLVTVTNMKDMKRLINISDGDKREAWIGLYNQTNGTRTWYWSLPGLEFNENGSNSSFRHWNLQFNNEIINSGQCVMTVFDDGGRWKNENCTERKPFICYDDKLILIKENKTWHEALTYCRQNHSDLVTITNMDEQKQAQEKTKKASTPFVWIGLRFNCRMFGSGFVITGSGTKRRKTWLEAQSYCREKHTDLISGTKQLQDEELKEVMSPNYKPYIGLFRDTWRWSDGSSFSFRHWNLEINDHQPNSGRCAMTGLHMETDGRLTPVKRLNLSSVMMSREKNWEDALYYCRDHHHDLVTITNMDQQKWIQEKVKEASTGYVWMGLRYTCTLDFWFWVSDEVVIYENWAKGELVSISTCR